MSDLKKKADKEIRYNEDKQLLISISNTKEEMTKKELIIEKKCKLLKEKMELIDSTNDNNLDEVFNKVKKINLLLEGIDASDKLVVLKSLHKSTVNHNKTILEQFNKLQETYLPIEDKIIEVAKEYCLSTYPYLAIHLSKYEEVKELKVSNPIEFLNYLFLIFEYIYQKYTSTTNSSLKLDLKNKLPELFKDKRV